MQFLLAWLDYIQTGLASLGQ